MYFNVIYILRKYIQCKNNVHVTASALYFEISIVYPKIHMFPCYKLLNKNPFLFLVNKTHKPLFVNLKSLFQNIKENNLTNQR